MSKSRRQKEKKALKRLRKLEKKLKKEQGMFGFGKDKKKVITPIHDHRGTTTTRQYGKNYGHYGTSYGTSYWKKGTVPTNGTDNTTLSIALFKQSTLDRIGEICLPKAGGSEFQVHYRALQIIVKEPSSKYRVVYTIPTVFFNMPQKVSTASVDFSLDEVAEVSDKVAPISEALSQQYYKAFPTEFFQAQGFEIEARETEIGSMHRHPGDFGFSSTDLDNKAEDPGVIYRTRGATDKIQVDSVMYIPNRNVKLVTTETRVIDVEPVEDGIKGTYLRAPTLSYIINDVEKSFDFRAFFGMAEPAEQDKITFTKDRDSIKEWFPENEDLFRSFLKELPEEYEPTLIIDPDMIKEEFSYSRYPYGKGYGYGGRTAVPTNDDVYDYYDEAFYDEYRDQDVGGEPVIAQELQDKEDNGLLVARPTWRKIQTLGNLRSMDVDVNNNANIDGSGSERDVRAIVTALTAKGRHPLEIKKFFRDNGYTREMIAKSPLMDGTD